MLRNARIIDDENIDTDIVSIGSTVLLRDLDSGDEFTYTIVGSVEANPAANKISNESPVGKAILGQPKEQIVEIDVPVGQLKYQIIDIMR
jgi:transcription elongation factor GreA